jgi:hypothetical protein
MLLEEQPMIPKLMNLTPRLKAYLIGAGAIGLFALGWWGGSLFFKTETKTVLVPVIIQNPDRPEQISNGVSAPAHHTVPANQIPTPPLNDLPPIEHPWSTDVTTVEVPVPTEVSVYHQNSLKFLEGKGGYNVWVDSRVWATDKAGQTLDTHSTTLFNKDVEMFIPVTTHIPVPRPWAVGITYSINKMKLSSMERVGLFVDRDWGPVRFGAEARMIEINGSKSPDVTIKAGGRF